MKPNPKNLVYIVDDDPDDRQIILDAFLENNTQMDYVFIENGDELMTTLGDCADTDFPSLILLDLNMPGKNGYEVLKEIKQSATLRKLPVVVFSTSDDPSAVAKTRNLGASLYITKPPSFSKLKKTIQYLVSIDWNKFSPSEQQFIYRSN